MDFKTLILYTFHELSSNVEFFIKHAIFQSDQYHFRFIINNENINYLELPFYSSCIIRKNIGPHDFGGWSEGLLRDDYYKKFNRFIFINSSVMGPFVKITEKENWVELFCQKLTNNVVLVGSTINTTREPRWLTHVQSYAFAVTFEGIKILIENKIFCLEENLSKRNLIIEFKEIKMSRCILKNGYNIGSMYPTIFDKFDFVNSVPEIQNDICYPKFLPATTNNVYLVMFVKTERGYDKNQLNLILSKIHNV